MTANDYVATVEYANREWYRQPKAFKIRARSLKHALRRAQQIHPDARSHEVELCRCSEINNDMCNACYRFHSEQ